MCYILRPGFPCISLRFAYLLGGFAVQEGSVMTSYSPPCW